MIDYKIEKLKDIIPILKDLIIMHYDEVAPYDDIPMIINWDRLIKINEAGVLKVYGMRKSGKLIGYASFYVNYTIEYSQSLQASLDNIFIHPDHRGQGKYFISWCDEQLKELGVQVVYHHVKARNDYGKLLKRLGYEKMNIEYSRRLDKG